MIKKVIILIVFDVLVLSLDIFFFEKPDPSVAIGEILFIPFLFIVNLVAALLLLVLHKKEIGFAFLFNAFLAPIFFHIIWGAWYDYDNDDHYKTLHFRARGSRYELTINKRTNDYSIMNNSIRNGSSFSDLNGSYTKKNGRYYLLDSSKIIIVTDTNIMGFPKLLDTVRVDIDSYYW